MTWTTVDIPDQTGRRVIVTGANSGLGYHTALELARHGAEVIMAVRDPDKGAAAADLITAEISGPGRVEVRELDLADLGSVQHFAESCVNERIDLLINNAGIMAIPRQLTVDGFERQFGTNHLGHMALTLRLLPALVRTGQQFGTSRVVTVSSGAHRMGRIDLADLMGEKRYQPWRAYGQSKLANLLFTLALQSRFDQRQLQVGAYAAHPGYANTNLQGVAPQMKGSAAGARMASWANSVMAQPAAMGALPTLCAATAPGVPPGAFVGPDGFLEQRGHPRVVTPSAAGRDATMAAQLWTASEALIGLTFDEALPA